MKATVIFTILGIIFWIVGTATFFINKLAPIFPKAICMVLITLAAMFAILATICLIIAIVRKIYE